MTATLKPYSPNWNAVYRTERVSLPRLRALPCYEGLSLERCLVLAIEAEREATATWQHLAWAGKGNTATGMDWHRKAFLRSAAVAVFQEALGALPAAIAAQAADDPSNGYTPPTTPADAPEDESGDDFHAIPAIQTPATCPRPKRRPVARTVDPGWLEQKDALMATIARHGLSKDRVARCAAYNGMSYATKFIYSFHELTPQELRQFNDTVSGGTFYLHADGRSWCKRVPARIAKLAA